MPEGSTTGTALLEIEDLHAFYGESTPCTVSACTCAKEKSSLCSDLGKSICPSKISLNGTIGIYAGKEID